jgi:hypothetical protein
MAMHCRRNQSRMALPRTGPKAVDVTGPGLRLSA